MAENKKKEFDPNPTGAKLFWRIQRECWRRMVTPYLMYLFMSLIMLALQAIVPNGNSVLEIILGILCVVAGAAFNAHLLYHTGVQAYDAFLTGCIHRRNRLFGIPSGGDHRVECEYSPWKGFYIGFLVGIPVILFGILAGFFYDEAALFFIMFAGWAIIPITWFGTHPIEQGGGLLASPFYSLLFILLPIIVSGVFYIVGAMVEKRRKEEEAERAERVAAIAEEGKKKRK